MKITELILVTDNWKGEEQNLLLDFDDFKHQYIARMNSKEEVAEVVVQLGRSQVDPKCWSELYFTANKSISARYCSGMEQLRGFLSGYFNENASNWTFDVVRSSTSCLETLQALGMDTAGRTTDMSFRYEKVEQTYSQGDRLFNFNGSNYRVLECLTKKNLLLMQEKSGDMVVAIGVATFRRTPKEEGATSHNSLYGIEWEHGRYLGKTPSAIDFYQIRMEYGNPQREERIPEKGRAR